ncbi:DUF4416 family protein [Candidatus Fermentibacteria bacterium]|nr:DUF4416 family protein [Candidatus Fermentibacteria bacterium]
MLAESETAMRAPVRPVLRLVSVISPEPCPPGAARSALTESFGPVALESRPYPFDMSCYYETEMGPGLFRVWLAFERLAPPDGIAKWKEECSVLEDLFRTNGSRTVNLDPGYLDFGKLVLASFKEAPDKICAGRGVWVHTCLRFRFGRFEAPDHSFPDFRDGRFDGFMLEARRAYSAMLRRIAEAPPVE